MHRPLLNEGHPDDARRRMLVVRFIVMNIIVVACLQVTAMGGPTIHQPDPPGHRGGHSFTVLASRNQVVQSQVAPLAVFAAIGVVVGFVTAGLGAWIICRQRRSQYSQPAIRGASGRHDAQRDEVARLTHELDAFRGRMNDGKVERERFLASLSHEIKTPIAVLMIEAQTIDRSNCPDGMLRFVETVEGEMTQLGELVESFLLLARIQARCEPAKLKQYCINDMVIDGIEDCMPFAKRGHITLRPVLLAHDATLDAAVVGDPDLLRTLVESLLRVSIRTSSSGSTVEIVAGTERDFALITVRSPGCGIPSDWLRFICEDSSRPVDSHRRGQGQFIELAIAKGIAKLHGGTIEAFNRDTGCEYVARLRLADPLGE